MKGHPTHTYPSLQKVFGNTAIFPTGALPGAIRHGKWNLTKVNNPVHNYLHKRLMLAEALAKIAFNPVTLPVRAIKEGVKQCGCN